MTASKEGRDGDGLVGRRHRAASLGILTWGFWVVPLSFYVFTASRTPGWADAPLIARTVHNLDFHVWVNNHNLFTLLGAGWLRAVPSSLDVHHALNLLCALLGSLTVHVVFVGGVRLTANAFASAIGAIALMVSHSMWWHSTMLEVYTLSTLLLALMVLMIVRYDQSGRFENVLAGAFCFGLACANHAQMGLLVIAFVGVLMHARLRGRVIGWRSLLWVLLAFTLGFSVYGFVFISELLRRTGGSQEIGLVLSAMVDEATGGGFRRYMFPSGLSLGDRVFWWLFYAGFFVLNFPSIALGLGPMGAWAWLRKRHHALTLTFVTLAFVAECVWSSNYLVWDMYAFALPVYTLFAVFVIAGSDWIYRRSLAARRALYVMSTTILIPLAIYARVPGWIGTSESAIGVLQRLPQYEQAAAFWDPIEYFFDPNKCDYDRVAKYSKEVLAKLEPNACYWGDEAKLIYPLKYYYQDVLGERLDVRFEVVFGMLGNAEDFQRRAWDLSQQLEAGCTVYVSSVAFPERQVLNYVYARLEPETPVHEIAALSTGSFIDTFPRYRIEEIGIDPSTSARIFRVRPRPTE